MEIASLSSAPASGDSWQTRTTGPVGHSASGYSGAGFFDTTPNRLVHVEEPSKRPAGSVSSRTVCSPTTVRERIYARALPLATRTLDISISELWPDSGVHGLARQVGELVLSGS